jgi:hypothetical protein
MNKALQVLLSDFRLIKRDGILLVGLFAPVLAAVLLKFGYPIMEHILFEWRAVNLADYKPLIIGVALLMIPSMLGMMAGFMLLDDRDEGLLACFAVTPLQKSGYIRYRIVVTMLLTFFLFFIFLIIADFIIISWWAGILLALLYALEAPVFALLLAIFSANKVEGLALNKVLSVSIIIPVIAFFMSNPLKWLLASVPAFWPVWALIHVEATEFWLYYMGGLVIHLGLLVLLIKVFLQKSEK